jgi:hypothetical protein
LLPVIPVKAIQDSEERDFFLVVSQGKIDGLFGFHDFCLIEGMIVTIIIDKALFAFFKIVIRGELTPDNLDGGVEIFFPKVSILREKPLFGLYDSIPDEVVKIFQRFVNLIPHECFYGFDFGPQTVDIAEFVLEPAPVEAVNPAERITGKFLSLAPRSFFHLDIKSTVDSLSI